MVTLARPPKLLGHWTRGNAAMSTPRQASCRARPRSDSLTCEWRSKIIERADRRLLHAYRVFMGPLSNPRFMPEISCSGGQSFSGAGADRSARQFAAESALEIRQLLPRASVGNASVDSTTAGGGRRERAGS